MDALDGRLQRNPVVHAQHVPEQQEALVGELLPIGLVDRLEAGQSVVVEHR
jgi:hypothetical protein